MQIRCPWASALESRGRTIHHSHALKKKKNETLSPTFASHFKLEIATLPPPDIWITDVWGFADGSKEEILQSMNIF